MSVVKPLFNSTKINGLCNLILTNVLYSCIVNTKGYKMRVIPLIALIFLLVSCDSENHTQPIDGRWKLKFNHYTDDIVRPYDSLLCDDGEVMAVLNGNRFKYSDIENNSDRKGALISDFIIKNEIWTFTEDSFIIDREGYEPTAPFCKDGKVEWVVFHGFPIFTFSGSLQYGGSSLTLSSYNPEDEVLSFRIASRTDKELILEGHDFHVLTFEKVE